MKKRMQDKIAMIVLSLGAIILIMPLFWAFLSSFKTTLDVFEFGLPDKWHFSNYIEALSSGPWIRYFINSAIMAGSIALAQSFCGALAGYSLAKFNYYGKNFIFAIVIGTLTLSQQVVFLPLFVVVSSLNWIDTYQGLIVPVMIAPFSIFLARQYISGISDSLIEAARIDGANEPRIFLSIIMPLSKPMLLVIFILAFTAFYNNLLWPLIVVRSEEMQTVALALQQFKSAWYYRPELVLAVTIITILPMTVIFFFLQKYFLQGVSIQVEK